MVAKYLAFLWGGGGGGEGEKISKKGLTPVT